MAVELPQPNYTQIAMCATTGPLSYLYEFMYDNCLKVLL